MPPQAVEDLPACVQDAAAIERYQPGFSKVLIFNGIAPFINSRAKLYGDAFLDELSPDHRPSSG